MSWPQKPVGMTSHSTSQKATIDLPDGKTLDYGGASVGVVCLRPDSIDADDALQKADAAMYRVKMARSREARGNALH